MTSKKDNIIEMTIAIVITTGMIIITPFLGILLYTAEWLKLGQLFRKDTLWR